MEAMEYIKRKATKHPGLAALGSVAVVLPFFMGPGADTVPPEVENLQLEHHVQTCPQDRQRAFFLGPLKAADLIPNHNRDSQSALKDHILLAINGLIAQSEIPTTGPDALHSYEIPGYTVNVLSRTPPQENRDDDVNRIFEAQVIEESYYEGQRCQLAALAIYTVVGESGQTITEFTAPDLFGRTRQDELMRITPDAALPIKESSLDPAGVAQTLVYAGTIAELISGTEQPIINPDLNPATSAAPSY